MYEENSLGVYEEEEEEEPSVEGTRVAVWGRYLAWHARRQLAFDMWWLGLALFLVCIIERSKLQDENNFSWFTIFAVSKLAFSKFSENFIIKVSDQNLNFLL